jgi:hypothetical protein
MLLLNNRTPASLGRGLHLDAYFVIDVSATVSDHERGLASPVVGYGYTVLYAPATEVVAYHWHPESAEGSADPHVHFGPASARLDSPVRPGDLHKVHFPTGFVSLEKFVWLIIDEFKVEPRRPNWRDILSQQT